MSGKRPIKSAAIPWITEIPSDWDVLTLKHCFSEIDYGISDSLAVEGKVAILRMGNIQNGKVVMGDLRYTDEVKEHLMLHDGDLLYNRTNSLDLVGKVGMFEGGQETPPTSFASYLVRLRLNEGFDRKYFSYLLNSEGLLSWGRASAFVAIGQCNLNPTRYGESRVAIPPLHEQKKRAAYLERETRKIDQLMAEQDTMLELQKEHLAALVLKNVDREGVRTARFGDVAHEVIRPIYIDDAHSYEALGLYNRGRGLFHKEPRVGKEMGESEFSWVAEGDLIFSGQFAWEGAIAMAGVREANCVVSHRYPLIRGLPGMALTEYLFALFLTAHGLFLMQENSRGAAGRNRPLNIRSLLKEKIPVPQLTEQKIIATAVYERFLYVNEIRHQISLLQERRSAIIESIVTGKIDV